MLSLVAIKLFQDGGLGGATAALSDPYTNDPATSGQLIWDQKELNERAHAIQQAGLRLSIHAIGDAAIRTCLEAVEYAIPADLRAKRRPRLEHCGLPLPPLISAIARLGIMVIAQPAFLWFDGDVYMQRVGPARSRWLYPLKSLLVNQVPVAGSSDGPVVPDINPLLGAFTAASRQCHNGQVVAPEEALDLQDALSLFTTQAAYACGRENHIGSLTVGKDADLVILSSDPLAVKLKAISAIPVESVFVRGQEIDIR
jgi:predicted amidohydrolase YtcJ